MRTHYPLNSAGAEDAGQLPWSDGVPSTGTQGSYPGHALFTDGEAEVLNAQALAGLVQSGTDLTQLGQAISRGAWLGGFTGSANALTATVQGATAIPSLLIGMRFVGIISTPNTDAVTVALSGFGTAPGAKSLLRRDGAALKANDLPVGSPFEFRYDGSAFRTVSPTPSEIAAIAAASTDVRSLTPAGASSAFVFTPGVAFSDFTGGATDSYNGPFTTVASLTVPAGAGYIQIDATAAFRVLQNSAGQDCRTRIRYTVQGGSAVTPSKYQGVHPANGNQIPCPIRLTLQGLDKTKSTFIELLVDSSKGNGSFPAEAVGVYDPRIDVQYG